MATKDRCECCRADITRCAYITSDDVWLCRKCFYEVPQTVDAGATTSVKGLKESA